MPKPLRSAALLAAAGLLASATVAAAAPRHLPSLAKQGVSLQGPIHGVVWNEPSSNLQESVADLQRLKADGVNLVSIYITWQIRTAFASDLKPAPDAPSDKVLVRVASLIHQQGLAVEWMPIIEPVGGAPRYLIDPTDKTAWWSKYTAMIDRYAKLAAANNIEVFSIGSELGALQKYTNSWLTIIDHVKNQDGYHGLTTYMSTTGQTYAGLSGWWGSVDLLSVSPYWSLSKEKVPNVGGLVNQWTSHYLPELKGLSDTYHRPVLMDEIGYPSQDEAAYQPSIAWRRDNPKPNEQSQANAYEGLLRASSMPEYATWLKGVVWFYWASPNPHRNDTSYSPRGKLAECVVAKYWAKRTAPGGNAVHNGGTCFATHLA